MARAIIRIPLKLLIFGAVTLFTLFPNPFQLTRHLTHVTNLEQMVQPNAPELTSMEGELLARLNAANQASSQPARQPATALLLSEGSTPPACAPRVALREVEKFVLEKVPYDWDWNVW